MQRAVTNSPGTRSPTVGRTDSLKSAVSCFRFSVDMVMGRCLTSVVERVPVTTTSAMFLLRESDDSTVAADAAAGAIISAYRVVSIIVPASVFPQSCLSHAAEPECRCVADSAAHIVRSLCNG